MARPRDRLAAPQRRGNRLRGGTPGRIARPRSHECDFPSGVKTQPVCTWPRVKLDGSNLEIDRKVKEIVD